MPLLLLPRSLQVNSAGVPYGSAKLYVYRATTLVDLPVYTTADFSVPHPQPVRADATGLFPAIYVDPSLGFDVRVILKTSADVVIYDEDGIPRSSNALGNTTVTGTLDVSGRTTSTGVTSDDTVIISEPHPRLYLTETDAASGKKSWCLEVDGAVLTLSTVTDGLAAGSSILRVTRGTGTAIAAIEINEQSYGGGTFPAVLTGISSGGTATLPYRIANGVVTLTGGITGTSNSTSMTLTGLPNAIWPSSTREIAVSNLMDNDIAGYLGNASISSTGIITFNFYDTTTHRSTGLFTASGTKGWLSSSILTYPL